MKIITGLTALILVLTSCSAIKPIPPDLPASQIATVPLPESKIDVPISIDMKQLLNNFTAKFPLDLSGEGNIEPGQYRWQMHRQPFDVSFAGDSLAITDAAHFSAGGYVKVPIINQLQKVCSCDVDAQIGISARFKLLNDYSPSGNAQLARFDLSACDLNILNFNITPLLKPKVADALTNVISSLNDQLSKYNFRPLLQPAWDALNQPVKIGNLGYLTINPTAVRIGQPIGSGNFLNLAAGITAKPVFSLGNPGNITSSSLPNISEAIGNGFNLNVDIHLDYQPLNQLLKNNLANQKIMAGANSYIIISDAKIYGSGNDHLLIKVKFLGKQGIVPYHGLLYFTCLPKYDANTGNLYITDLNFDVNTKTKLQEGPAAWILSSAIKKFMNSQVHFNIAKQVNIIKDNLIQALNMPISQHITLAGNVDSLNLQGILPESDYILVRVSTSGSLGVKIN